MIMDDYEPFISKGTISVADDTSLSVPVTI